MRITERVYYRADNGNYINVDRERCATTDFCSQARFNISSVNFFRRQTHRTMRRAAAAVASLRLSFSPILVPLTLTESDDKMTKGWSPQASDITVSVSELCELSSTAPLLDRVLRPKTLRDWLCPPYFWCPTPAKADWWRTYEKERHVRKRDRNAVNACRRDSKRLKRDRKNFTKCTIKYCKKSFFLHKVS